jgi:hypothetical protein
LAFAEGHIAGSSILASTGSFAPWVGALITDPEPIPFCWYVIKAAKRKPLCSLARVGYDHTLGYLKARIQAWREAGLKMDTVTSVPPADFEKNHYGDGVTVLDVRRPGEYEKEHVANAFLKPLDYIHEWKGSLDSS